MKVIFDPIFDHGSGGVEVPKFLEEQWRKEKEEALKNEDDAKFWSQDDNTTFCNWFDDWIVDNREEYEGTFCDKVLAEILVAHRVRNGLYAWGYPIENWMEFEDNGFEYFICAYGWTAACEDSKGYLEMIGYKEKITSKEEV